MDFYANRKIDGKIIGLQKKIEIQFTYNISFRCLTNKSVFVYTCKMVTIVNLVNIHHYTQLQIFLVKKTFKFYSFSNFQIYSTELLAMLLLLLLLLLLSHFSHVQLCVNPQTAAHQAPPSLGFSRQEHWSGETINLEILYLC